VIAEQKKERLWQIRRDIMNLVNEAESLIGVDKECEMTSKSRNEHLVCVAKLVKGEAGGINKTFTVEQEWSGDDRGKFYLNVGVVVHCQTVKL
jgi:hypothetical protein